MAVNPADSAIYGSLFGSDAMRALFSDANRIQTMLDVEAALARVEARLGLIPKSAATAIAKAAKAGKLSLADIAKGTAQIGVPAAAVAKALGRAAGGDAPRYVHWGATSQDIVDSALILQLRAALDLVERDLKSVGDALAALARKHRGTAMAGRTYLQQALPVTFGYKCAVWLAPLAAHRRRLAELKHRLLVVQFGGAVGTLASLGTKGRAATEGLARELGLAAPVSPWHANREALAETAAVLGLICGSLAKFAADLILLSQTEVGEAGEPAKDGRGGSSTLPQKRNPVASAHIVACVRGVHALVPLMFQALVGDHERSAGAWQSETLALPQIFLLTSGALKHAKDIAKGLRIDAAAMRRNLNATHGVIVAEAVMMALAESAGRDAAHELVQRASQAALARGRPLAEVLTKDPAVTAHLDAKAIARLTDPARYLGEAKAVVARVLAAWRAAAAAK